MGANRERMLTVRTPENTRGLVADIAVYSRFLDGAPTAVAWTKPGRSSGGGTPRSTAESAPGRAANDTVAIDSRGLAVAASWQPYERRRSKTWESSRERSSLLAWVFCPHALMRFWWARTHTSSTYDGAQRLSQHQR